MDIVIESLVKRLQEDHGLQSLPPDEAFEAFAGYCVLSTFHEDDFSPDVFRMGGGNDLGIDVFGIKINGACTGTRPTSVPRSNRPAVWMCESFWCRRRPARSSSRK